MESISLKTTLKLIREKIDAGLYSDALNLLKDLLERGVVDYTLFLFAGYVNYVLRDLVEAARNYQRAIQLDSKASRAWKGIFSVYSDSDWSDFSDEFALVVINELLKGSSDLEKKALYEKTQAKFLVGLKKFDLILAEWDHFANRFDSHSILELLKTLDSGNKDHRKLGLLLLSQFSFNDCDEEDHAFVCGCVSALCSESEHFQWILDHLRKFTANCHHNAIISQLFARISRGLLSFNALDAEVEDAIGVCLQLPVNPIVGLTELCKNSLEQLHLKNLNTVYELLLEADLDAIFSNNLLLAVAIYVYRQLGQFHKISLMLEDKQMKNVSNNKSLHYLKLEANFIIAETSADFEALSRDFEVLKNTTNIKEWPNHVKCIFVQRQILLDLVTTIDEVEAQLRSVFIDVSTPESDALLFVEHFCRALFYYHAFDSGKKDEVSLLELARDEIRQAIQLLGPVSHQLPLNVCNVTALNAQIITLRGQQQMAITQLVNAAQKDAYCSKNFRLLAEYLFAKSVVEKAKLCAERAMLLNPRSELTAKLLCEIYSKESSPEKIVKILSDLLEKKPSCTWALKQSAIMDINDGHFEVAIEKIQRLVRLKTAKAANIDQLPSAEQLEMCSLWIYLSEAYKQCGNLQSAMRSSKSVIEIFPQHLTALFQLVQLYQSMGQYENAISTSDILLKSMYSDELPLHEYAKLLHANALILFITEEGRLASTQIEVLPRLFNILRDLLEFGTHSALLQKISSKSLDVLLSFNAKYFDYCISEFKLSDDFWKIHSREDAIVRKLQCVATILKEKPNSSNSWNELAKTFLLQFILKKDVAILERCIFCIRNALKYTSSKFKISEFYCTLGKVYVFKNDAKMAQHCFIRAIQLDSHSANAWCLLSLLYMKCGLLQEAYLAMNEAQKIDPHLMEAWCAHAMHAEATNDYDTMDLYRHTIFLKPTDLAVKKYCYFLMRSIREKRRHEEGAMLDFEVIKDLMYKTEIDDDFVHAMALLAEHFWHFDDAMEFIRKVKNVNNAGFKLNYNRISIKNMVADIMDGELDKHLSSLRELYKLPVSNLFQNLQNQKLMNKLFTAIKNNNVEEFSVFYKSSFYPLIVSACILFELTISQELFAVVENVRPLHKLVDVYPLTGICRSEFFTLQQQDEEEKILVRRDYLSEKLYNILLRLADKDSSE